MHPAIQKALAGDYSEINQLEIDYFSRAPQLSHQGTYYETDSVRFSPRFNPHGRIEGWRARVMLEGEAHSDCANCDGTGAVSVEVLGIVNSYELDDVDCPDCSGSGKLDLAPGVTLGAFLGDEELCASYILDLCGEILEQLGESQISLKPLERNQYANC
jgi:hypothetical protein